MANGVGGDLEKVSIKNEIYVVTGETDVSRVLGGLENEILPNGDGVTARQKKTRKPWRIGGLQVSVDDVIGNQQANLQEVADGDEYVDIVLFMMSGAKWSGKGQIVGELSFSNQNTAASFDLSGPGKLVRQ